MDEIDDEHEETFDDIMAIVGDYGPFQKIFNWNFNIVYALVLAMTSLNFLLVLSTPEHWCHVPGRPENLTIEEWRNLTIPLELNTKGEMAFSKCKMYNGTHWKFDQNQSNIISCQHGWEYSKMWYDDTFTSSENWVCDREYYVTHALTLGRVGDIFGTSIFGYFADITGRRPVFFVTVIGMVLSRFMMLLTKSDYYLYMLSSFFAWFTLNAGFQSPITIILEITHTKHRAIMLSTHIIGWIIGGSLVPILMWAIRRADYFIIATTVPGIYVLITYRYLIESPRWLLSRQRVNDCYKQLKIIARVNKRELPDDLVLRLKKISKNHVNTDSRFFNNFLKMFANWRMTKHTVVLVTVWCTTMLNSQILIYYVEILEGNPFINFMLQIAVQGPSCLIGKMLCDHFGRRFSFFVGIFGGTLATLALIFFIRDSEYQYIPIILTITVKFLTSIAHYVLQLQVLEIYPTCIRQTGASFCIVCDIALSALAPGISSLGKTYDARYPYIILFITNLMSTIMGPILPETKNKNLPETMDEAKIFGADQSYFSCWTTDTIKRNKINKTKKHKNRNSLI